MSNKNNIDLCILNRTTGEIINELEPGDKIIKAKTIEKLKNTIELDNNFIKLFSDSVLPVVKQLTDTKGKINYNALSFMFYLMQFISYETGLLIHTNGRPLTNDYIINNFNMSRSDIYRCLKMLKDKQIIAIVLREDKKQYYMFNPFIANKGKRIDKTSIDVFDDTIFADMYNKD